MENKKVPAHIHVILDTMNKGIFILLPIIIFGVVNSRPREAGADRELKTSPTEAQTALEEAADEVSIQVAPGKIIQGDPVLFSVRGLKGTTTIRAMKFHNKPVEIFLENGEPRALVGIDLRLPSTLYPLTLTLSDGRVIQENVVVGERTIAKAPLGIPEKLGGNTPESESDLVSSLVEEGKLINSIESTSTKLWKGSFRYPVNQPVVVTDVYGYSRETGSSNISHKGTDFRAPVGTLIYAMNTGAVAWTGFLRNYGHTIVLDHGLGLQTIYMHLSQVSVEKGERVEKGEVMGKSGDTGYVLGPHLHLSVKIDHISIDPEKFMEMLGD